MSTNPICPGCGHEHIDAWEWKFSNDIEEIDCENCGEPLEVQRFVSVTYSTTFLGDDEF